MVKGVLETLYAASTSSFGSNAGRTRRSTRARRPRPRQAGSASSTRPPRRSMGAFELDLDTLFAPVPERIVYEDVLTFPAVLQDIAVAVAEDVEVGALVDAAHEAAGALLREARVFDVIAASRSVRDESP